MQIGASHPLVRQILMLQRGQSGGDDSDVALTVAEGLWANEAVLAAGARIPAFLWCEAALRGPEAIELAKALRSSADTSFEISAKTLERITERDKPDGLISLVELPQWQPDDLRFGRQALVLVADGIEQPGNLGTLIRTLDACGADALVLTNIRTRRANTKVFRASHATTLRVPTVEFDSVAATQHWLDAQGFQVLLADTENAIRYTDIHYEGRVALVMGNERYGITANWYRDSASRVFIPMLGAADSLNVSISAAVLLYEVRSQLDGWR